MVKETDEVRERIREDIVNKQRIITAKFDHLRSDQISNKILEVSPKFQERLAEKRDK